jgi:hypothetical protein
MSMAEFMALAAVERKLKEEEQRLALEEAGLEDAKRAEERVIMFMNPTTMDKTARKYWELTRGEILTQRESSPQNGGGFGGGRKDGDDDEDNG